MYFMIKEKEKKNNIENKKAKKAHVHSPEFFSHGGNFVKPNGII